LPAPNRSNGEVVVPYQRRRPHERIVVAGGAVRCVVHVCSRHRRGTAAAALAAGADAGARAK